MVGLGLGINRVPHPLGSSGPPSITMSEELTFICHSFGISLDDFDITLLDNVNLTPIKEQLTFALPSFGTPVDDFDIDLTAV